MIKRDQNKNDISERNLSLQDKILFHQAKVRELKSFFENGVWSLQTTAVPDRTFTSRILLKWAKNADGTQGPKHVWLSEDTPTLMLWLADWTQLHQLLPGLEDLVYWVFHLVWAGADGAPMSPLRFCRGSLRSDFCGSNSQLMLWRFWAATRTPACFCTSLFTDSWTLQRGGILKHQGVFGLWIGLHIQWTHAFGVCMSLRLKVQLQFYVDFFVFMWMTCWAQAIHSLTHTLRQRKPWKQPSTSAPGRRTNGLNTVGQRWLGMMMAPGALATRTISTRSSHRHWRRIDRHINRCLTESTRCCDNCWAVFNGQQFNLLLTSKHLRPCWAVKWAVVYQALCQRPTSCSDLQSPMQTFIWSFLQLVHWKISESLACLMQLLVFDMINPVKVAIWFCSPTKRPLRVLSPLTIFWIGAHFVCHVWRGQASQLKFKLQPKPWIALSLWFVFGICFWIQLPAWKDTLQISNPSLAPTFITDAKALYDSFHRDAINHGATDKRTNLELRVIREQVEGIGGVFTLDFLWAAVWRWLYKNGSPPTAGRSNQTWCDQIHFWSWLYRLQEEDSSSESEKQEWVYNYNKPQPTFTQPQRSRWRRACE